MQLKEAGPLRAVAYARFSSDLQREESIDAQVRAIREFAGANGMALVDTYVDKAYSATTDQRPAFQQMIADSRKRQFDVVLVHKLDRFARNRQDSAIYKHELNKSGVKLRSVLENFHDSPESAILESVVEGFNEYYSKNLAREVKKGLKENALKGHHTGGVPPLGYRLNKETMMLEEEPLEVQAVKQIFQMTAAGAGYGEIVNALNHAGYRTKRGSLFGRNSIYDILRNEKYTGTYVYNKSAAKDNNGKMNRHKYKSEEEIIRVPDALPQLVSREVFDEVQQRMAQRRHKAAKFTAKQNYLLSGKIRCGVCQSAYVGNARHPRPDHPLYVSYRCSRRNGSVPCKNPEIPQDAIEQIVCRALATRLFRPEMLPALQQRYEKFLSAQNTQGQQKREAITRRLQEVQRGIDNVVEVVVKTGSAALTERLSALEKEQQELQAQLEDLQRLEIAQRVDFNQLTALFCEAKRLLETGSLQCRKKLIEQYVEVVEVLPDRIHIVLRLNDVFHMDEWVSLENKKDARKKS